MCVFDPLDGSSNIACGVAIGSVSAGLPRHNSPPQADLVCCRCDAFYCVLIFKQKIQKALRRVCLFVQIFGIYKASEKGVIKDSDTLQPGKDMVAAGYCMYGSSCVLVLTIG